MISEGELYEGSTWEALLFAKHHNGKFILRIEDTDQTRKQEGSLENILKRFDFLFLLEN